MIVISVFGGSFLCLRIYVRNVILFQNEVFGRIIKETAQAMYFITVAVRPSFL